VSLLTIMMLSWPSADLPAQPTNSWISTLSGASVSVDLSASMESVEPAPLTQSTTRTLKTVTASLDILSAAECASPRPQPLDLLPPHPFPLGLVLTKMPTLSTVSASARLDTIRSTEFVSSVPQELSTMWILVFAESPAMPTKSTTS